MRPQLLIHLDGEGGTGKTMVILTTCQKLEEVAASSGLPNPVLRSAPTGVAAHAITGRTLHALFRLPIKAKNYECLSPQNAASLQAAFRRIRYLIIDEKSMVGLNQLAWIDRRCREIFPESSSVDFGGLNVVLAGDFFQLPLVIERVLFYTKPTRNIDQIAAQRLYKLFDRTIRLTRIMRQEGAE